MTRPWWLPPEHTNEYFGGSSRGAPYGSRIDDWTLKIIETLGVDLLARRALRGELDERSVVRLFGDHPTEKAARASKYRLQFWISMLNGDAARTVVDTQIQNWWRTHIGYALFTVEYQRSLLALLHDLRASRVIEVAAGRGLMQSWFRSQGFDWRAFDPHPVGPNCLKRDGLEVAQEAEAGTVFFTSWLPLGSRLDIEVARLGRPLILLGEPQCGATGSHEIWEDDSGAYQIYTLGKAFRDVPQWPGAHDCAVLVLPPTCSLDPLGRWGLQPAKGERRTCG